MCNKIISDIDREYIENKYHRTDEPFDAFNRMAYHGYEYDCTTGMTDDEIDKGLEKVVGQLKGEPHCIIKAKAVEFVLDNTRIDINEHDYFPGIYSWGRLIDKHTINIWHEEAMDRTYKTLNNNRTVDFQSTGTAWFSLDYDHTVPDYDSMMSLGFCGILERLRSSYKNLKNNNELTSEQESFFTAAETEYKAIIRFVDRLYRYSISKDFDKQKKISASLAHIRDGAPQNTYDALLMIYLYFMISECIEHYQVRSLGYGLDATLYPFYKNDIENGIFSVDEIKEFVAYFLMQFSAQGNYWGQPMYLGGTNLDGSTKVNELTYLILDVYAVLDIYNPKIQIKINKNTPKEFVLKALDMIRNGSNSIVFCNEDTVTKALMRQGATYEKAVDSVLKGCYEYVTKADTLCISYSCFNALKAVELVFNNGADRKTGIQVGIKTGDIAEMRSFEDFYTSYRKQFEYIVKTMTDCIYVMESHINEVNPSVLYSATIPRCVDTLKDANDGGIKNVSSMWLNGLGSAVDSLMAVWELVFETKQTTLAELKEALDNDWEGYEVLRAKAKNCRHKYGNGDRMADYYANAIHQLYSAQFSGLKNCHGGNYEYELHSARSYLDQGMLTGATPDGRKYGDETSKNASPSPGADRNGVTALIRSATTMDLSLSDSGACLDAMLHSSAVKGKNGLDALYAVIITYLEMGGASIHFNIFDVETLLDAQEHPENYKNLQVRVCGWNVLWNNLTRTEQNAYIERAKNIK